MPVSMRKTRPPKFWKRVPFFRSEPLLKVYVGLVAEHDVVDAEGVGVAEEAGNALEGLVAFVLPVPSERRNRNERDDQQERAENLSRHDASTCFVFPVR